ALGDEALRAVGPDVHDAAARIRRPQRAVALRKDAFGPLQPFADIADGRAVDDEAVDGVGAHHGQPQKPTLSPPFSASISRASAGVAMSRPSSSRMRRIFATCSALLAASWPLPI